MEGTTYQCETSNEENVWMINKNVVMCEKKRETCAHETERGVAIEHVSIYPSVELGEMKHSEKNAEDVVFAVAHLPGSKLDVFVSKQGQFEKQCQ